jgi:hypothetical protein
VCRFDEEMMSFDEKNVEFLKKEATKCDFFATPFNYKIYVLAKIKAMFIMQYKSGKS